MARRMLHTEIWQSKQVASLSLQARLLYVGLITLGDDDGRLKGDVALLRAQIFPRDAAITIEQVTQWLEEIVSARLVVRYEVDDEPYLAHPNWTKYQTLRADRKKDSNVPPPPADLLATIEQPNGNQMSAQDKVSKGKVSKEKVLSLFEEFWKEYPNKTAKKKALESWVRIFKEVPNIELADALAAQVMSGLAKAKKSSQWTKNNGDFVPHPTTWLNQERWNDEGNGGTQSRTTHRI